jgi:hypothetical protein
VRRRDDLVAGLYAETAHGDIERSGAVRTGNTVFRTHLPSILYLELFDIGTSDVGGRVDDGGNSFVYLGFDGQILRM